MLCSQNSTKKCHHSDGLVQDCSNSSALALELLQSCTKQSALSPGSSVDLAPIVVSCAVRPFPSHPAGGLAQDQSAIQLGSGGEEGRKITQRTGVGCSKSISFITLLSAQRSCWGVYWNHLVFLLFQNHQITNYSLNIKFMFNRFHHRVAVIQGIYWQI